MKHQVWGRVVAQVGRELTPTQEKSLLRYRDWLRDEAIPLGAIGPEEGDRLEERHIADSLLFLHGWEGSHDPTTIWDLGSGAGLPGIPIGIVLPQTEITLVDRSGRRSDLLRRVVRLLDLGNVSVLQSDIGDLEGSATMIVSRATLSPERLGQVVDGHLGSGGVAVLGGSWVGRPTPAAGWEVREIPPDSLDRSVWLLIMRR